ncbi:hypothetical protein ACWKSP_31000 [Micromonosporaceae bacterium Da 78-11]
MSDASLERHYRRLLLAYPRRYRRHHGTDMVTTLLEMAEPGQTRPARADVRHLFASGVRQRFRLPAGRPLTWAAAVLTTLILGAFGAATGSWLATRTFTTLPDQTALLHQVTGTDTETSQLRDTTPWTGEAAYGSAQNPNWTAEPARQALTAAGWHLSPVTTRHSTTASGYPGQPATPGTEIRFDAHRDGLALTVDAHLSPQHGTVHLSTWAQDNGTLLPAIVLGTLTGLLLGWPITAAAAYRIRHLPTTRARSTAALSALAIAALALPAVAFAGNVIRAFRHAGQPWPPSTVHSALTSGAYYPFGPTWLNLGLTLLGLTLTATTLAGLLPRPTAAPQPDQIPTVG